MSKLIIFLLVLSGCSSPIYIKSGIGGVEHYVPISKRQLQKHFKSRDEFLKSCNFTYTTNPEGEIRSLDGRVFRLGEK